MRRWKSFTSAQRFHVYQEICPPFHGKVLTCLAICKKEENQRDRYTVAVCKVGETVGHLNCVCYESLITIATKIHGKSFAVANKSAKTAKVFHSKTFALYDITQSEKRFISKNKLIVALAIIKIYVS